MQNSDATLRNEVVRLRKQLRITQWGGVAVMVTFALWFLTNGRLESKTEPMEAETPSVLTTLDTMQLVLRDQQGAERAVLQCGRTGQPMLTLLGVEGGEIELGFTEKDFDMPTLSFNDSRGQTKLHLYTILPTSHIPSGGGTGIDLRAGNASNVMLSLKCAPGVGSQLSLKPASGGTAHATMLMHDGFPAMQFLDSEGTHVLDVPPYR